VARAELEAKGVVFAGETMDTGVCHMAIFTDPDGNDSCCITATPHTTEPPRTRASVPRRASLVRQTSEERDVGEGVDHRLARGGR